MKIGINCRSFLKKNYTGIGRYAYNLVRSLNEIDRVNTYYLYAQKNIFDLRRSLPSFPSKNFIKRIDWMGRDPRRVLTGIDLYHSPSLDMLPFDGVKIAVTVHDLVYKTYPAGHTPETIQRTEVYFKEIVAKATKIICCSQSTREDLMRYFSLDKRKICVVHQGVDKEIFRPLSHAESAQADIFLRSRKIEGPFILFVGTIEPRKNLRNLIHAFSVLTEKKQFSGPLVIVGMRGWMSEDIAHLVSELGLKERIIFLGYLTDRELSFLYNKTAVFVFPSFYEGFGFPLVEAFSCGAAVVTSARSSCPEVAGEAALFVTPEDPQGIAEGIARVILDEALAKALRQKALTRAQDFSFQKTAQETLKVYEEVYREP